MLTLEYPSLMRDALDYPQGLRVLWLVGRGRPILLVKTSKETILAAKRNGGFKIYVVEARALDEPTIGLVSAFFDDDDEPLVVITPLFDEPPLAEIRDAVLADMIDVYFFDELDREWLGYRALITAPTATRARLSASALLPLTLPGARSVLDDLRTKFGVRGIKEDEAAMSVRFEEALFPDDLFQMDLRPEFHNFQGSKGYHSTGLVREEPGAHQEYDIVRLLQRTFPGDRIVLNPLRTTDNEEIADILVLGASYLLIVQAKDSPNTDAISRTNLYRKRSTTRKFLRKALRQSRGAIRYLRSKEPVDVVVAGKAFPLHIRNLAWRSLVVVKELFDDEYRGYSKVLFELTDETQVPVVALDYAEVNRWTAHLRDETTFFAAYDRVIDFARTLGEYPRLRLGLIETETSNPTPSR